MRGGSVLVAVETPLGQVAHLFFGRRGQPTRFLIPHFLLFSLFAFTSAGAVDKIVFPEGMQSVNFGYCYGLTGTAELGMSDGQECSLIIIMFIK